MSWHEMSQNLEGARLILVRETQNFMLKHPRAKYLIENLILAVFWAIPKSSYLGHGLIIITPQYSVWARFLVVAQSKLRLCSPNHRPGYWSNLPCDWPSTAWAYSEQETENGPWCNYSSMPLIAVLAWYRVPSDPVPGYMTHALVITPH